MKGEETLIGANLGSRAFISAVNISLRALPYSFLIYFFIPSSFPSGFADAEFEPSERELKSRLKRARQAAPLP
jgi:hypothetical protein